MDSYQKENSYSTILKRISSFGGVQMFNILINLVRGKFVAMFLGPEGMGMSSLLTSSTQTVQQFGSLGLNLALVKEIAAHKDNGERLPVIVSVALRLIVATSLLGALACLLLSPLLSKWSFGSYSYTASFAILSVFVFLSIAGAGYLSLLQGMSEVKRLAKASLIGSGTGLVCGVPLYYFFGYAGIVPAMIILALAMFLFYFLSWRKAVSVPKVKTTWKEHGALMKRLLSLGFILMMGSLAGTMTNYAINAFVRYFGSVEDVGLFQAANSLTNQYVGIIFSALAMDYFPRLSAISNDVGKMKEVVNRQAEIVTLVITPLVLALILTTPLVIRILLTDSFLVITPLVRWLGIGVMVQSLSFPLDYIFLAKDNRKVYVWLEVVGSNILWIVCSMGFYYHFSLIGLGISLVARGCLNIAITYIICRRQYQFRYSATTLPVIIVCLLLGTCGFLAATFLDGTTSLTSLSLLLAISLTYSGILLRRRLKTANPS